MAGKRNPYGSISTPSSERRKKRLRNEAIRTVLATLLICVLVVVIGFLGVNALKGMNQTDKGKETGSESTLPGDDQTSAENEVPGTSEAETEATTEAPTEPTTEEPSLTLTKEHVVWLDAGHGGDDLGGAVWVKDENGNYLDWNGNICGEAVDEGAYKVREKEQTLQLTLLIKTELENYGVTVLMTRTDDTKIPTKERPALANETNAECFISLHRNFMRNNQEYNGIEIWGVNKEDFNNKPEKAKDQQLGEFIIEELMQEDINGISDIMRNNYTGPNGDDYSVLWRSNMPALILEMGYMSNDSDNEKYETNLEAYAAAIADGIVRWLQTQE